MYKLKYAGTCTPVYANYQFNQTVLIVASTDFCNDLLGEFQTVTNNMQLVVQTLSLYCIGRVIDAV